MAYNRAEQCRAICRLPTHDRPRGRLPRSIELLIASGWSYQDALKGERSAIAKAVSEGEHMRRRKLSARLKAVWAAYRAAKAAGKLPQ